jgi:hypothetical protein
MTVPASERVRLRRGPRKGRYDRDSVTSVLDAGLVAHVAFVAGGQPYCLPMLYARAGEEVLIHGSRKSRLSRALADGTPACLTVTVIRGLVLGRSAFEHSANYECAIGFGCFRLVDDAERSSPLLPRSPSGSCRVAGARCGRRQRTSSERRGSSRCRSTRHPSSSERGHRTTTGRRTPD